MNVKTKVG